jgi:hypothetical protein
VVKMSEEVEWSVLLEAELGSDEDYLGEAEDRIMRAAQELGIEDQVVAGGGPEGYLSLRFLVPAESRRTATDRGVARFVDALTKSGLGVGPVAALEVVPVDLLRDATEA